MELCKDAVVQEALSVYIHSMEVLATQQACGTISRWPEMTPIEQVAFLQLKSVEWMWEMTIEPQKQIEKYRVDFLVTFGGVPYVIECDGHDFHERTKEQAQQDKKRDRELQRMGFKVYRFTGSEIWRSRGECITKAIGAC